eukprot:EG_transcript_16023
MGYYGHATGLGGEVVSLPPPTPSLTIGKGALTTTPPLMQPMSGCCLCPTPQLSASSKVWREILLMDPEVSMTNTTSVLWDQRPAVRPPLLLAPGRPPSPTLTHETHWR